MIALVFQSKPCQHLMNRLNYLKHIIIIKRKEREKRNKKNI